MSAPNQPEPVRIDEWMDRIEEGKVGKPRWQRGYVWDVHRATNLLSSIVKRRPIGTLLTIDHDSDNPTFKPIPLFQPEDEDTSQVEHLILDGQQRLTTIWLALSNRHPDREFYFRMDKVQQDYDSIEEAVSYGRRDKKRPKSPKEAHDLHLIPMRLLRSDPNNPLAAEKWTAEVFPNETEAAYSLLDKIKDIRREFGFEQIFHFRLNKETDYNQAIDIFLETNRTAKIVSTFDIAVAKFDANDQEGFRELLEDIDLEPDRKRRFFGDDSGSEKQISDLGDVVLKIACILDNAAPTASKIEDSKTTSIVRDRWVEIVKGLNDTLKFLEDEGIWDHKRLPRDIPLRVLPPLFLSTGLSSENDPDRVAKCRKMLRTWLWRSLLTERYDRNANRRLLEDYTTLKNLLDTVDANSAEVATVDDRYFGGRDFDSDTLKSLRFPLPSPTTKASMSRSVFAITLRGKPYDFANSEPITMANIGNTEYHHLFPKSRRKEMKRAGKDTDVISALNHPLNFSLLRAGSNKTLGNKDPKVYLSERMDKSGQTQEEMQMRLSGSLIPYEELSVKVSFPNYRKFIESRAEYVFEGISQLLVGDDWRPKLEWH